jgi:Spy/CpxP family protein refolding chaperone
LISRLILGLLFGAGFALTARADNSHHAASPYAGEEARAVSSLSAADVADLLAGKGWGFAKPAELNGYPGPLHVLQLEEKLKLTPEQRAKIQAIFDRMAASARETGAKFVEAERALDSAFKVHAIDEATLAERVEAAEVLRAELRRIHLSAHLETTPILTPQQRHAYVMLRGYQSDHTPSHRHHHAPKAD